MKDIAEIMAIEQTSFNTPWSKMGLAGGILDPLSTIFMVKSSCQTIIYGYSCYKVIFPEAELLKIAVSSDFRHRGIGQLLLIESLRRLQLMQVTELHLEVSEKNREAIALYKKVGFFVSGRRPGYYDNGTTTALLLQHNLSQSLLNPPGDKMYKGSSGP